jgi:hypothetical protein
MRGRGVLLIYMCQSSASAKTLVVLRQFHNVALHYRPSVASGRTNRGSLPRGALPR